MPIRLLALCLLKRSGNFVLCCNLLLATLATIILIGIQITGGYFADPGKKDVPRLADCGYPIAEVDGEGNATITKLEAAGGAVTKLLDPNSVPRLLGRNPCASCS